MSMFLLVTIMTILMVAFVRVIVVVRVVSRRNLREVVEVAAYGKSAILGIWAAYGSFRLTLQDPSLSQITSFFLQIFSLELSHQVGISILSIFIPWQPPCLISAVVCGAICDNCDEVKQGTKRLVRRLIIH